MEAISLFAQKKYDLVLLDILLPKIDGYGVCELIRKQSRIPIVMLTALDSEADQIKGLDLQKERLLQFYEGRRDIQKQTNICIIKI